MKQRKLFEGGAVEKGLRTTALNTDHEYINVLDNIWNISLFQL